MANKSRDAMMLMSFINPDSIPKNAWNQIITAAANRPSMLLNYIDADVELIWPVSKRMDDGHYVEISHGLRSKDDEMEDE